MSVKHLYGYLYNILNENRFASGRLSYTDRTILNH